MNLPATDSVRLVNPRRGPSSHWRWLILILPALGSLFFAINPLDLPRLLRPLLDLSHVPIFAFAAGMVSRWVGVVARQEVRRQLFMLCGLALLVGSAIELTQPLAGRNASVDDIIHDVAGAAAGVLFCSRRRREFSWRWRRGLQLMVLAVVLLAGHRAVGWYWAYSNTLAQFPLLADFELPYSAQLWSSASRTDALSRDGSSALHLHFQASRPARTRFEPPRGDWAQYATLRFSLFNPRATPLEVQLAIADRSVPDRMADQRPFFIRRYPLAPGWNDLSVRVGEIAEGSGSGVIDIDAIGELRIEVPAPDGVVDLYLDAIRLDSER